jgi:hypothetical protein
MKRPKEPGEVLMRTVVGLAAVVAVLWVAPPPLEAQGQSAPAPANQPPAAAPAVPAAAPDQPSTGAAAMSKVFNPDMAVIGNFVGASGRNPIDTSPAMSLKESEVSFQAIVDPYARADFFLSFGPDGVEVEEGFITFQSLPGGLVMKVGRLREAFGKVNTMHTHVMPWVDRPLIMRNLFGGEEGIKDSGLSVAKLIPNPWLFLEAIGEVYSGNSGVYKAETRGQLSYVGRLRAYGDLNESSNVDLGGSIASGFNETLGRRKTTLIGVDATFRYRPLRRAIYRKLLLRTELIWSRRDQMDGMMPAFGMYGSGEYQFARRWFAGLRYDYAERAADASLRDTGMSAILTLWPSEFSQVRGQLRRTRYAEGITANEFLFQFLFSIGAHGAHTF